MIDYLADLLAGQVEREAQDVPELRLDWESTKLRDGARAEQADRAREAEDAGERRPPQANIRQQGGGVEPTGAERFFRTEGETPGEIPLWTREVGPEGGVDGIRSDRPESGLEPFLRQNGAGRTAGAVWAERAVRQSLAADTAGNAAGLRHAAPTAEAAYVRGSALDAEELDRLFQRDARRYDGGFQLL